MVGSELVNGWFEGLVSIIAGGLDVMNGAGSHNNSQTIILVDRQTNSA